ncbi:MAG: hypothetical protein AB8H79_20945, partial [Myxococcota bacterium]
WFNNYNGSVAFSGDRVDITKALIKGTDYAVDDVVTRPAGAEFFGPALGGTGLATASVNDVEWTWTTTPTDATHVALLVELIAGSAVTDAQVCVVRPSAGAVDMPASFFSGKTYEYAAITLMTIEQKRTQVPGTTVEVEFMASANLIGALFVE